jgi:GNAT superfamily N-acetyltransferase
VAVEIKQVDTLDAAARELLFDWGEDIFGTQSLNLRWRSKDLHFLIYSDGKLVSHAGILKHVVKINDQPIVVGGLGGVVTLPEAQRKGFARRLVQRCMSFMESEWKVDAGLLFCSPRMVRYYESLGWQVLESPVMIEQPSGKIASPLRVMVLPFGGMNWLPGSVELQSFPW